MNRPGHLMVGAASLLALEVYKIGPFGSMGTQTPLITAGIVGATLLGSYIPDIDLKFKHFFSKDTKYWVYHRQITHSLLIWVGLFIYLLFNQQNIINLNFGGVYFILLGFVTGALSHLVADMITGTIPIFLKGNFKIKNIFNARFGFKIFGEKAVKFFDKMSYGLTPILIIGLFFVYHIQKIIGG